jgi:hypothetical protein
MLLGVVIVIHTDHKNLTFDNLSIQRELGWRSYVEEYSPGMNYLEGPYTILADGLLRCHRLPSKDELANVTYVVPLSDTDSIGEIGGCFLEAIGPIDSRLNVFEARILWRPRRRFEQNDRLLLQFSR